MLRHYKCEKCETEWRLAEWCAYPSRTPHRMFCPFCGEQSKDADPFDRCELLPENTAPVRIFAIPDGAKSMISDEMKKSNAGIKVYWGVVEAGTGPNPYALDPKPDLS